MSQPRRSLFGSALLCSLAAVFLLSACGSSGPSSSTSSSLTSAAAAKALKAATAARRAAEAKAPRGASPTLRAIYAQFTPPKPNPEVKRSTAAIRAGIAACKGKTPVRVKEEFYAVARRHLSPEQAKLIARIDTYEKHSSTDASFASGQLAADVYEATLPAGIGQYGYEGCIYSLAQGLEHRLAPR